MASDALSIWWVSVVSGEKKRLRRSRIWPKTKYSDTRPAMPRLARTAIHLNGTPAMKKTAMKVVVIRSVWPISGWINSRETVRA